MTRPFLPRLAAIILTGGASSRMGEDKGSRMWGDRRAVDLVAELAMSLGAAPIVTAGSRDYGLPFAPDPQPFSGPVAGVLAGSRLIGSAAPWALVLAVDAPTLSPADLQPLFLAPAPGAAYDGLPLPMWLNLQAISPDAQDDWPLRRLVERAGLAQLSPPPGALARLRGANTPEEQAALLAEGQRR